MITVDKEQVGLSGENKTISSEAISIGYVLTQIEEDFASSLVAGIFLKLKEDKNKDIARIIEAGSRKAALVMESEKKAIRKAKHAKRPKKQTKKEGN